MSKTVNIIGAGLAGAEACYQLSKRGINVNLYEMKPVMRSPAHTMDTFAELVCSNSFRSDDISTAPGLLKREMQQLDSLIINTAREHSVPAGGALACDRSLFSKAVTDKIKALGNVNIIYGEVCEIDTGCPTIISTGPLTSENLLCAISKLTGEEYLHFFDAAAPIVDAESIDMQKAFCLSRYGKGDDDYINCPMNKQEYLTFYNELVNAECVEVKQFENNVFEGCMPIEVMAKRGEDTMRFGPLKPVGLIDPRTDIKPYAVVQLRKENVEGTMYNLVGFQTHLKFGEQKRVFSLIPGLENAEFLRYGVMHKNTYITSPKLLNKYYQLKSNSNIFFAGQITGVEGYIESACSGLVSAINVYKMLNGEEMADFTNTTMLGALSGYISQSVTNDFQPMKANFGILLPFEGKIKDKKQKKLMYSQRALSALDEIINKYNLTI